MDLLRHYWTKLQTSLLLIPMAMTAVAVAAAFALLDPRVAAAVPLPGWLRSTDPSATRELLNALLNGIITALSLVMSLTMVVLTLAAAQIGSRLIRSFIDDSVTQAVLGLFLATLLYLIVVLRALDGPAASPTPDLATATGVGLAAACLLSLIVYVDRLARSIVFDHAAMRTAHELHEHCRQIAREDEAQRTRGGGAAELGRVDGDRGRVPAAPIALGADGYVQSVSWARLIEIARRDDLLIVVGVRPGQWVNADTPCIDVFPPPSARTAARIRRQVIVGWTRTPTQDLEYGLQRLVEMALRALSPGMNDVFTALAAVDNLGASLARIFAVPESPRLLRDAGGVVRVERDVIAADHLVSAAFDQIRESGAAMPAVAMRMLDALGRLAPSIRTEGQRQAVLAQIEAVRESAGRAPLLAGDVAKIDEHYRRAKALASGCR